MKLFDVTLDEKMLRESKKPRPLVYPFIPKTAIKIMNQIDEFNGEYYESER